MAQNKSINNIIILFNGMIVAVFFCLSNKAPNFGMTTTWTKHITLLEYAYAIDVEYKKRKQEIEK